MQTNRSLPLAADRIGALIASVLLTFALGRFAQSPGFTLNLSLPGFYYAIPLTLASLFSLFAAALAAAGMDWLIREHPSAARQKSRKHLLLPALTAFVLGTPLAVLSNSAAWWWAFIVGAILFSAVCVAEYISADINALFHGFARAVLTSVSYALFLILVASLRLSGARMVLLVPSIFFVAGLISLRILNLDGADNWDFSWALGIGLICAQFSAGLHYWPLSPIQFGLALTGPLYALILLANNLSESASLRRAAAASIFTLAAAWIVALLLSP